MTHFVALDDRMKARPIGGYVCTRRGGAAAPAPAPSKRCRRELTVCADATTPAAVRLLDGRPRILLR